MQRTARLAFNHHSAAQGSELSEGLTFLIRTDAQYATNGFRRELVGTITNNALSPIFKPQAQADGPCIESQVKKSVHAAYQEWGERVLESISQHVNYDLYDIDESVRRLNVQYHNARALGQKIVDNADSYLSARPRYDPDIPTIYVSLDEMFHECRAPWGEIAFSRLFSLRGDQQFGYTARPGKQPIDEQVATFAQSIKELRRNYGQKLPLVLLEDNVRHAKMLNWVIELMDRHSVFDDTELACISTCFCSASQEERAAIIYKGQSIPLVAAIELNSKNFEVSTPRDLFFDGYVVEVNGEKTRLPGLFMDVEKLFKVSSDKAEAFTEEVRQASLNFCNRIEQEWGISVPVGWFTGAKAIAFVTGKPVDTPMTDVLETWKPSAAPLLQAANDTKKIGLVQ